MRLREMLRFELEHHLRRPVTWVFLAVLLLAPLTLGLEVDEAGSTLYNAPVYVALSTLLVGVLGMLVTAGLFAEAGHRDLRWRMEPLFYNLPLRKHEYLGGRFLGALLVNALLLLAVPVGLLLSTRMPGVTPEMLGPFRAGSYLLPYLFLLLPNLLINAAVLFGLTTLSRRSLPGYLGALGLFAGYVLAMLWSTRLDSPLAAALVDPTGIEAMSRLTGGWTPVEQNTRMIPLRGVLLWNRLLWTGLGLGVLAFTFLRFRPAHAEPGSRRRRARLADAAPTPARIAAGRGAALAVPRVPRSFGIGARARQTLAVARIAFRQTVLSREFLVLGAGLFLLVLAIGMEEMVDGRFGTPLWPLTHQVTALLTHRLVGFLIALVVVFYAGELVWREREAGVHELGDTRPVPDWVPFAGNALALGLVLVLLQAVLVGAGMVLQALKGYYAFELGVYLQLLFGLQLADYLLLAVLALLVHVLVDQKYLGHMAAMLIVVAIDQAGRLGIEHNLLVYGSDPGWGYSDLSRFGSAVAPFLWFKLYWASWALLLGVLALLFWARGTERGVRERLRLARRRFTPRTAAGAAAAALLVLATGGFVFYNTNVLNEYRTAREAEAVQAEYERRYKRFEHAPQPWLTGMRLHVELYPERRRLSLRGTYLLVNRTDEPIDSVHLSTGPYPEVTLDRVRFDRAGGPVLADTVHGYRIYALQRALQPGDSLRMQFRIELAPRGFRNRATPLDAALAENSTFLDSRLLLPSLGYQRDTRELSDPAKRREHGLAPRSLRRAIDDPVALRQARSSSNADWIHVETTVGTTRGQTALAPGRLRSTWTEGDRSYFRYRTDAPVLNGFGLISADYAVHESRWNDVEIRVLHHPDHAFSVEHIVRGARASLEYFSTRFGPYPHRQLLLVELPHYVPFTARAYPGQIVYSEGSSLALGRIEGDEFDTPVMITAHEVAHQWWGHQVMGANVEGSPVLSETLAQYSALMVMEEEYGAEPIHRLLRTLQIEYLNRRGSHETPEAPLLLTTDHNHIHYRKGAVVMYALKDLVGEERVNTALRNMVRKHGMQGPPYPTTLDLYRELQAATPDSLRYLLEDLLANITLWDLQATGARAEPVGGGEYRVTLDVEAAKLRADSIGNDTEVPMNDLVEIGVFAAPGKGERLGEPLYLRKHRIRSGRQTITVTVPGRPAHAGIDPHHKLIGRHKEIMLFNTVVEVETGGAP